MNITFSNGIFNEKIRERICNDFQFDFESKESGDFSMSNFIQDYISFINKQ